MKSKLLRQGDVLLRRCGAPKGERTPIERKDGRIVLAEGEHTGHAHAIKSENVSLYDVAGRTYLQVGADVVALEHEEHSTIDVERGWWEVRRQVEYQPAGIRQVAD